MTCTACGTTGWVLDARTDLPGPVALELLPCLLPECPWSGRPIATLAIFGQLATAVPHPETGHVMALTDFTHARDR